MEDQNQNTIQQQITDQSTTTTESVGATAQVVSPAPTSAPPSAKVLTIPSNAMAKIKREEREKGRKAAMLELDAQAKRGGFGSWDEMMKAAAMAKKNGGSNRNTTQQVKAAPVAQPAPTPVPAQEARFVDRAARRAEKERERALEEVRRLNRARATEEKRRKDAEKRVEAMEAEMALRTAAIRAGVQDVDYALELLRRKINGKNVEELRGFSEDDFFVKELRSSHPYLYGVTDIPANTTAPVEATKARVTTTVQAKPTSMPAPTNGNSMMDARKLSPQEYTDLLQRHGIKNPMAGL